MTGGDFLSLDRVELERRRALCRLRNTREFERKKLLARLLRAEQRAVQLRQWISRIASSECSNPIAYRNAATRSQKMLDSTILFIYLHFTIF